MRTDELLEELEKLIDDAKELPVVNKVMVDKKQIQEIIDEIQSTLPEDTRQAKAIVSDRSKIIREARAEAESIIKGAEVRRAAMIDESDVVLQAREKAEKIVEDARVKAKGLRNAADSYVDDLMERAENALAANYADFKNRRESLIKAKKQVKKAKPTEEDEE